MTSDYFAHDAPFSFSFPSAWKSLPKHKLLEFAVLWQNFVTNHFFVVSPGARAVGIGHCKEFRHPELKDTEGRYIACSVTSSAILWSTPKHSEGHAFGAGCQVLSEMRHCVCILHLGLCVQRSQRNALQQQTFVHGVMQLARTSSRWLFLSCS